MSTRKLNPREYAVWNGMKQRCSNPKTKGYSSYGGRGISVCERWKNSFEAFLEDMGNRPSYKHSIDRINNDGNYEPSNCRWATPKVQGSNKRKVRSKYLPLLKSEISKHKSQLCIKKIVSYNLIRLREKSGLSVAALAKKLGTTKGYVRSVECGWNWITYRHIAIFTKLYKIEEFELFIPPSISEKIEHLDKRQI